MARCNSISTLNATKNEHDDIEEGHLICDDPSGKLTLDVRTLFRCGECVDNDLSEEKKFVL
jgi:hypothetical protein